MAPREMLPWTRPMLEMVYLTLTGVISPLRDFEAPRTLARLQPLLAMVGECVLHAFSNLEQGVELCMELVA